MVKEMDGVPEEPGYYWVELDSGWKLAVVQWQKNNLEENQLTARAVPSNGQFMQQLYISPDVNWSEKIEPPESD